MPKIEGRVRITKRIVDGLVINGRDYILWDAEVPGFGLRVRANGRKLFVLQYAVHGRTRRLTLGELGGLTPDAAREQARALRQRVKEGGDPAAERDEARRAQRLDAFFEDYLKRHAEVHNKPRSVAEYGRLGRQILVPRLGTHNIDAITHGDAQRLHHDLSATPYQANRALELLSRLMTLAEMWGFRPRGTNPCKGIPAYREQRRQRFLSSQELAQLGSALRFMERERTEWHSVVPAIRLVIFTGARVGEILTLKWEHVDFERRCLNLPDSKTGAKVIHLNPAALKVLAAIERHDENAYVIRGRRKGTNLVNIKSPWSRIRKRAKLDGVRIHDLRHTYASVAAASGSSLPIIGALLGHTQSSTTQRYAHLAADPLKEATDRIGAKLAAALASKPKEARKVTELKRAKA